MASSTSNPTASTTLLVVVVLPIILGALMPCINAYPNSQEFDKILKLPSQSRSPPIPSALAILLSIKLMGGLFSIGWQKLLPVLRRSPSFSGSMEVSSFSLFSTPKETLQEEETLRQLGIRSIFCALHWFVTFLLLKVKKVKCVFWTSKSWEKLQSL